MEWSAMRRMAVNSPRFERDLRRWQWWRMIKRWWCGIVGHHYKELLEHRYCQRCGHEEGDCYD